jgi:tagaturonate reductase
MKKLNKNYVIETLGFSNTLFELPEKVLQFGTGVLLRGLTDFLIDQANKQGIFEGRVVVVKSTGSEASNFSEQDNLYTIYEKGISNGKIIENTLVNAAISRVLAAPTQWESILACAENPNLTIIVSNTTEVGLQYVKEPLFEGVPSSYPAKLTAFLYERFSKGQSGMTIVATELIVDNGKVLKQFVLQHCTDHQLSDTFVNWLETECDFCSSLVDRIVPGSYQDAHCPYEDTLAIQCEPFLLWAVEGGSRVKERLSFAQHDSRLIIAEDITPFREQKLRLLNGGHTISVPLAYLKGARTVHEMMSLPAMNEFVSKVLLQEILPTLTNIAPQAEAFAHETLSRFSNPFIQHKLLSITWQSTSKMQARNALTIERYHQQFDTLPPLMCRGFAAYLRFSKITKAENGKFEGTDNDGNQYPIVDDKAPMLKKHWDEFNGNNLATIVENILSDETLFSSSLKNIPLFTATITNELLAIIVPQSIL